MTLYNVMFPLWMLIWLVPIAWVITFVINYLWDSLILTIGFKCEGVPIKESYIASILRVYLCGFLADFVGSLLMLGISFLDIKGDFLFALQFNPFSNILAFIIVALCIFMTGVLIYFLNTKYCLKKTSMSEEQIKRVALKIAVFTAPYFLLFPSCLLYF